MKTTSTFALLCCVLALLAFSLPSQPASAGWTLYVNSSAGSPYPDPAYYWGEYPDPSPDAWLDIEEEYDADLGLEYDIDIWGYVDEDPILSITKEITNGSAFTWLGYEVDLDTEGDATFVGGSASSDTFALINETATSLDFGLPSPLAPGDTVTISFDILIPTAGDFVFTLSQSPIIPEPATATILGIGGAILFVARRRSR